MPLGTFVEAQHKHALQATDNLLEDIASFGTVKCISSDNGIEINCGQICCSIVGQTHDTT